MRIKGVWATLCQCLPCAQFSLRLKEILQQAQVWKSVNHDFAVIQIVVLSYLSMVMTIRIPAGKLLTPIEEHQGLIKGRLMFSRPRWRFCRRLWNCHQCCGRGNALGWLCRSPSGHIFGLRRILVKRQRRITLFEGQSVYIPFYTDEAMVDSFFNAVSKNEGAVTWIVLLTPLGLTIDI